MNSDHRKEEHWMREALALAARAEAQGEVPVGALLLSPDGVVLGRGWNQPIASHDPTAHAEVMALREAGVARRNYRLPGSTLYVTLEPCAMCVGAIVHARVARVVFGAFDAKTGAAGSAFPLLGDQRFNHRPAVVGGVLEAECTAQLRAFFRARRARRD